MHHTIDKIPNDKLEKKYQWQKKHLENKTGTVEKYTPVKISKKNDKKRYKTWK